MGAVGTLAARQDMVRYYASRLAREGHAITPDHVVTPAVVHVADSRAQALRDAGPYTLYFFHTLFSHGNLYNVGGQRQSGYVREEGLGWLRPENRHVHEPDPPLRRRGPARPPSPHRDPHRRRLTLAARCRRSGPTVAGLSARSPRFPGFPSVARELDLLPPERRETP